MGAVLYVDDEPAMRRLVQQWLEHRGIDVRAADGIVGAQRACTLNQLDGIFIDIWLKDGSGFELYSWLEEHYPALARNTVFVTGDVTPQRDTGRRLKALGMPVLAKPFDLKELERYARGWSKGKARGKRSADEDERRMRE
jgi:CheY-like chemotaxis protein